MAALRHRTFVGPGTRRGGTLNENREVIRAQAEPFVNTLGIENVVSVSEHAMSWGPFSVVVWYRSESAAQESSVVQVSNATIAGALRRVVVQPAAQPALAAGRGQGGAWLWLIALLALASLYLG